jgi:hypothetical protein
VRDSFICLGLSDDGFPSLDLSSEHGSACIVGL